MFNIDNKDEFNFKGMVMAPTGKIEDTDRKMLVQYERKYDNVKVILNSFKKDDEDLMSAKKTISYEDFVKEYGEHRIYLEGFYDVKGEEAV